MHVLLQTVRGFVLVGGRAVHRAKSHAAVRAGFPVLLDERRRGGPAEGRETRDTGDDWTRIFREERAESQVPLTSWIFREERARGWQAAAAAA